MVAKVDRLYSEMIRLTFTDKTADESKIRLVNLENLLSSPFIKTLEFYGTLTNAVNDLLTKGYGGVELPPYLTNEDITYLVATKDMNNDIHLNMIQYAPRCPTKSRPVIIDGAIDWQTGDIVYNTDFISNRCQGWICTEQGSPGTWETIGNFDMLNDRTSFQIIDPGEELPPAKGSNLGKFLLYTDKEYTEYNLWYCTRYFEFNPLTNKYMVGYKWINSEYNKSPIKHAEIVYDYEGWYVTRIDTTSMSADDSNYYRDFVPNTVAIYGTVPVAPEGVLSNRNYQTIKIGKDRYFLHYYDDEYVREEDIPAGIQILLFIDYSNKIAWLPYQKRRQVALEIVSELPTPNKSNLGKRVLYQVIGLNDYPVPYYCTQIVKDNAISYKWIPYTPTKYPVQVANVIADENNNWVVTDIGTHSVVNDKSYSTKIADTLLLICKVPTNSYENQKLIIDNHSMTIRYLDGGTLLYKDIMENSVIQVQVNLINNTATLGTYSKTIVIDRTIVRVGITVDSGNNYWNITAIGETDTSALNQEFKLVLPDKLIIITQVPENSVDNQRIMIGSADYDLVYINGVQVMKDELIKGTIIAIHGSLSSKQLFIPAFPSIAAQQLADMTALNNKLDVEIDNRKALGNTVDNYKKDTITSFDAVTDQLNEIRQNIMPVTSNLLAYSENAALSGIPTAPTANEGDSTNRIATTSFVMTAISKLINESPESLDTLYELAKALGEDPNFSKTVLSSLANKLSIDGGTVNNTLNLTNTAMPSGTSDSSTALIIGGSTVAHTEFGLNAIQSKLTNTMPANLNINRDGGLVVFGVDGIYVNGPVIIKGDITLEGNIELTGNITTPNGTVTAKRFEGKADEAELAYNIPDKDSGGNIWIDNGQQGN